MHKSIDRFVVGVIIEICFSRFPSMVFVPLYSGDVDRKKEKSMKEAKTFS